VNLVPHGGRDERRAASGVTGRPPNLGANMKTKSWVIRNKNTKVIIGEIFNQRIVDNLNTDKYEAIPILEYLQSINGHQK
jgi:hypothetical protein